MDTKYKSHSFVKLWIATTIFILCCFITDMSAQNTAAADTVAAVTETITEVVAAPAEEASAAPDTVGELALGLNTVWMLLAAMLVFFMQPGFALVEAGFTRVKNTANILMKNFVDFMFGSLLYWFIGFGLMFGAGGFIGMPHFCDLSFIDNGLPTEGFLIFQTVFCATAATIVSGAMAERTKFSMYIVYTIFISVLIYPISGHWTWGGGWLMNGEEGSFMMSLFGTTFHDFAGSTVVHSVGGWIALVGAAVLGPRIGKYGKDGKSKAKILAEKFETIDKLAKTTLDELIDIDDIGSIIASCVVEYFSDSTNLELINKLKELGLNMKYLGKKKVLDENFAGKRFVLTGTLKELTRDVAKDSIVTRGGKCIESVSSKTDVVIVGENPGSKYDKAKLLGIPIWSEQDFLDKLRKENE